MKESIEGVGADIGAVAACKSTLVDSPVPYV